MASRDVRMAEVWGDDLREKDVWGNELDEMHLFGDDPGCSLLTRVGTIDRFSVE